MIIKNRDEITSYGDRQGRLMALDILEGGLTASDPYANTCKLIRIENGKLIVGGSPEMDVSGFGDEVPPGGAPPPGVFILHRGDFLVRSHASELQRRFAGRDVLQYLLVDGEILGAVCGRWGFHPYDVEDIALDLPSGRIEALKKEIIEVVENAYPQPRHRILHYAGAPL